MGKATREANEKRREEIAQHVAWSTLQDPIVRVLVACAKGGYAYAPMPAGEWKPSFMYYPTTRVVIVPIICNEQVVIPAGYRQMHAVDHRGKYVVEVLGDVDDKGIAKRYMLELAVGLEAVLPGGKVAKLVKQQIGGYTFEEPGEVGPGAVPDKKPGRRPGRPAGGK